MVRTRDKVIAIDFDGTIYDNEKKCEIDGAIETIRKLKEKGYTLVLFTCRNGNRLQNAKNILKRFGIYDCFYSFNKTPDFVKYKTSEKVCASVYIDDRNIGGFIGWKKVEEILLEENKF